jgi:hypothetical protein
MAEIVMRPDETFDQFLDRAEAQFRPPTPEGMEELRRLLPPVRRPVAELPERRSA